MMSSETSTDSSAHVRLKPGTTSDTSDALQPWQLFTLAGLIGATVVVFVSRGQTPAGIILLSLTIFAAAVLGLAVWRTLAPLAGGERPSGAQILGGRTRAALEREKALVLRAIKDLEFDRAMGKMSEKDFSEISQRLRLRAAGLIRQLDAGTGYRDQIERELAQRIGSEPDPSTGSGSPRAESRGDKARPTTATCASCSTSNDVDAKFCKHCGAALED